MANCSAAKSSALRGETGGASLISMITVLAAFLLVSTYLSLAQANLRMSSRDLQSRQALYLAEAGVEMARAGLAENPLWQPPATYQLTTGAISLSFTQIGSDYQVLATGRAGEAIRKIEVTFRQGTGTNWKISTYREVYN